MADKNNANRRKAVLIIGASASIIDLVSGVFPAADWDIDQAVNNAAALAAIERKSFEVILTAEKTSAAKDLDLLRRIRGGRPHTRMIILTDRSTPADVIAAMREHAFSLFTTPFNRDELRHMLTVAMKAPAWDDGIELISATPEWVYLFARCDLATADRLAQFVNEIAGDLDEEERRQVGVAFREMLLNALEHGDHVDPNEYVEISYLHSTRAVSCRVRDPGEGFLLDDIPHAAIANPPANPLLHLRYRSERRRRPRGFGLLLARSVVDELICGESGNEMILIKYLDKARDLISEAVFDGELPHT